MYDIDEQQAKTLRIITQNEPMLRSNLTRRLHMMGIQGNERESLLACLIAQDLVKAFKPKFRLSPGPIPTTYEATKKGRDIIDELLEQERALGAC